MATLRQWRVILHLELNRKKNIREQIIEGIIQEIRKGRLLPGTLMPGSRELAGHLNVNRNTIIKVYQELAGMQIIKTIKRKGTFVTENPIPQNLPVPVIPKRPQPAFAFNNFTDSFLTAEIPPGHWQVRFDDGYPDPKLAPGGKFITMYKNLTFQNTRQKKSEYTSGNSYRQLVTEVSRMLRNRRGLNMDERHLCLMLSTRMALYMVTKTLLQPGDTVVVENPGSAFSWQTFERAGATLLPVDVDEKGICTDKLEMLCNKKKIKAVYIKPGCQYPTTVTLSQERRKQLLLLAEKFGFAIIETDFNYEFCYDETATLPLAAKSIEGNVIYITNLSRMMAPLNLIGCVAGPEAFMRSLQSLYYSIYQRADAVLEQTVADMMKLDIIGRHARASTRIYKKKRDAMAGFIDKYLHPHVNYHLPAAGLAYWLNFDQRHNIDTLRKRLSNVNVWIPPTNLVAYNNVPPNALRIGFAALTSREAEKGIIAISQAFRK